MREHIEADGTVCLILLGDLDLGVAGKLSNRLSELKATGRRVRLDLSQLGFIDSSGIGALLPALTDARWNGWSLEVDRRVSPSVEKAARILRIAEVFWPEDPPP
jgi:anti-anti-sigma factor